MNAPLPLRPVEIIGGGLAGLALGLALRRAGVPVALHDAGNYPRHRVCGEFIAGLDAATRDRLQLDPFLADSHQACDVAWFHRARQVRRQRLPSPAHCLSRHRLDTRLADAFVAAGGELHAGQRCDLTPRQGRVLATGRRRDSASPWIGLKAHVHDLTLATDLEVHLGDECYVGLSRVEDGWINVCGLFRRRETPGVDRTSALTTYLRSSKLDLLADRFATGVVNPDSCCAVAGLTFDASGTADAGLGLGDRVAMIPPFTGNGMAIALQSAAIALDPLLAWSSGRATWETTQRLISTRLTRRFRVRLRSADWLHPFLLRPRHQRWLAAASQTRLLPLRPLYHALH